MTVSIPTSVAVREGDGIVEVCAILSGMEDIQRNISIMLITTDETGKNVNLQDSWYNIISDFCLQL